MLLSNKNRNYKALVNQAEGAFLKGEFLEAFLMQSCIIEGVLRNYALVKLSSLASQSSLFKRKLDNLGLAQLIDELFASGKINPNLYNNLDKYRKSRNNVVHKLLQYKDKKSLDTILRNAYLLGRHMKGFIVDDMLHEVQGKTVAELNAQISNLLLQIQRLQNQLKENPMNDSNNVEL